MTGSLCVYCGNRPVEPDWRPFCSERCKLLDLRNWIDERYSVPGDPDDTETLSEQSNDSDGRGVDDTDPAPDGQPGASGPIRRGDEGAWLIR